MGEFSQFSIYPIRQRFPEYMQLIRRPSLRKAHVLFKLRRVPAVALDHGADQEPRQHSQVEAGFFAGGLVLPQQRDELSVGLFDLCLRFCKEGIQLFLPGAVLQEIADRFLVADVLLLQPMLKARAVVAIHAVKKAVVSACSICQQLRRQWAAWGGPAMVMFQQIPHGGKAVIHGAAGSCVLAINRIFQVCPIPQRVLSHVVQKSCQLRHGPQLHQDQGVFGILACLPAMLRDRLADFPFLRPADVRRKGVLLTCHWMFLLISMVSFSFKQTISYSFLKVKPFFI